MHGWIYSSDERLSDRDLADLGDALAIQLHNTLGWRVLNLQRADIAELLDTYICDLDPEDQQTLCWIVWHLFQDASEIARQEDERRSRKHRRR